MKTYITRWLLTMLALCAFGLDACAPAIKPYGNQEIIHLEKDEPAPWPGWLMTDAELEFLLKKAHD